MNKSSSLIQKNWYHFRKNNSSLRVWATFLGDLNIRRNYVFFRRFVGIYTGRFALIQAHGFTHRCCKHRPPHCLVVKMMKLEFFNSPRIRKWCCSSGVVGCRFLWVHFSVYLRATFFAKQNQLWFVRMSSGNTQDFAFLNIATLRFLDPLTVGIVYCSIFSIKWTSSKSETPWACSCPRMMVLERNGTLFLILMGITTMHEPTQENDRKRSCHLK